MDGFLTWFSMAVSVFPQIASCYIQAMKKVLAAVLLVLVFAAPAFGSKTIRSTFKVIEDELLNKSPSGGVPRYEHDNYFASQPQYLGNPWFVTTLWLAQYYLQLARNPDAAQLMEWTLSHALPSGVLSEQINPTDGSPLSVTPLVWSHAETINTLLDLQT